MLAKDAREDARRRNAEGSSKASEIETAGRAECRYPSGCGTPRDPSAVLRYSGHQRERLAHDVHAAAVEGAEVERREQPLVRIDDDRVGAFPAGEVRARIRAASRSRRHTPRRRAARCARRGRCRRSRRPDRRSSSTSCRWWRRRRSGVTPSRAVLVDRGAQRIGAHAERARRSECAGATSGRGRAISTALSIEECACSEQ